MAGSTPDSTTTSDEGAPADPAVPASSTRRRRPERRYSAVTALVWAGILVVGVLGVSVALLIVLARSGNDRGPEAALSLVFVAAAVVLILVVCTLTIVFRRLEIYDPGEAMGLPRGSVRAVIALLLIMLFFISAVFLFNSTKNGDSVESRTLEGISEDRFNEIATEDIQSAVQRVDGGETVYDVTRTANTSTSDDIAKQLVTTVATLVTAVAAFYFGANSVSTAVKEQRGGGDGRGRRRFRDNDPQAPREDGADGTDPSEQRTTARTSARTSPRSSSGTTTRTTTRRSRGG